MFTRRTVTIQFQKVARTCAHDLAMQGVTVVHMCAYNMEKDKGQTACNGRRATQQEEQWSPKEYERRDHQLQGYTWDCWLWCKEYRIQDFDFLHVEPAMFTHWNTLNPI